MAASPVRTVIEHFLSDFSRALRGEPVDMFGLVDENASYVRHGREGSDLHCTSLAECREKAFPPEILPNIRFDPGAGLFPVEFIEEGEKIAVLVKGRGEMARGVPYNNTYLFLFEVKGGRIVRIVEDLDASLSRLCLWDMHLEEGDALANPST